MPTPLRACRPRLIASQGSEGQRQKQLQQPSTLHRDPTKIGLIILRESGKTRRDFEALSLSEAEIRLAVAQQRERASVLSD
jgi:hypothetical protein